MPRFSEQLQCDISQLESRIYASPLDIIDPNGLYHHEFNDGAHGRKIDCDKIPTTSDLFLDWSAVFASSIRETYHDHLPDAVVGMANGANRLSQSIAPLLGSAVVALTTEKVNSKTVRLDAKSRDSIEAADFKFVLELDDVGTTGSTTSSLVPELRAAGIERLEVFHYAQRQEQLVYLDRIGIPYHTLTHVTLPTFSAEECASQPGGYCFAGIPLISHDLAGRISDEPSSS